MSLTALALVSALAGWSASGALAAAQLRARGRLVLVAHACHELRGPLCAARLALAGLAAGRDAARVAAIDVELRRATLALDDLAAARHGRRARERIEAVDVAALVRAAAESWRPVAAAHGAGLAVVAVDPGALVRGDRVRLAQACANLVANAAEHGGGLVRVRVQRRDGRVRVEVGDDGPGLPAALASLCSRSPQREPGRGHGLAIAAAIAQGHGGRLATAPAAKGARVVLELPAIGGARERSSGPSRRARRRRRGRRRLGETPVPAA
jgi:signal transduction histidine kinase